MAEPVELTPSEERRLWAKAIADLNNFCELLSQHAEYIIPGEHVAGFKAAWDESKKSFDDVQNALANQPISDEALSQGKLDGANGALKRSILQQLGDAFLGLFVPEPRNGEKLRLAAAAGVRYADMGAVAMDSLGACLSELPGYGAACKVGEEGLLTVKHLLEMRGRRG